MVRLRRNALPALLTFVVAALATQACVSFAASHPVVKRKRIVVHAAYLSSLQRLYPGRRGDVALTFVNTGGVRLVVTAVVLPPAASARAAGYSDRRGSHRRAGCSAAVSTVQWTGARAHRTTVRRLPRPITLAPGARRTVRLPLGADMGGRAPRACANAWFGLPRLRGVVTRSGTLPAG